MTEPTHPVRSKRILIALDTSARGQAALQAAVQLATAISAELEGIFVEDEDLVRLASLPFAREIDVTSALMRPLEAAVIERELRTVAERTQQTFSHALEKLNLTWTFRTVRGTVALASLAAAGDADLLVIGQRGRSLCGISMNYLPDRGSRGKRVLAVFDGTPSALRALELASTLAKSNASPLTVLVLPNSGADPMQQCVSWLRQSGVRAEVDRSQSESKHAIIDYVKKYPVGMLVINRDSSFLDESQLCDIVNQFDCPLVLC